MNPYYDGLIAPAHSNHVIGVHCFVEMHRRILNNKFGSIPKPLRDDAFSQGGYCLDAPDLMPGGSCFYEEIGPPEDGEPQWIVAQRIVARVES